MMKKRVLIPLLGLMLVLLIGCAPNTPTAPASPPEEAGDPTEPQESGYPVKSGYPDESGYPADTGYPADSGYPAGENPAYPQAPDFAIDTPVKGGDTQVTGTGPEGVPILLVDVSEVGLQLGEAVIASDGTFAFELDEPLAGGHMIGLQLGDVTGTGLDPDDFVVSENYYVRPLIGILFDMVLVEE